MSQDPAQPDDVAGGSAMSFEDTLDRLEERRRAAEADILERLSELEARSRRVVEAAGQVAEASRRRRVRAAERQEIDDHVAAAATALGGESPTIPWPDGGGTLRRLINRFMRWAMRDYLEVMDRRGDALTARVDSLHGAASELAAAAGRLAAHDDAQRSDLDAHLVAVETLRDAVQTMVEIGHRMQQVVDAKDAEVLQRAVAGPMRKIELTFDELARQQEALLAELVGRRRELEKMIERLSARGASAG